MVVLEFYFCYFCPSVVRSHPTYGVGWVPVGALRWPIFLNDLFKVGGKDIRCP